MAEAVELLASSSSSSSSSPSSSSSSSPSSVVLESPSLTKSPSDGAVDSDLLAMKQAYSSRYPGPTTSSHTIRLLVVIMVVAVVAPPVVGYFWHQQGTAWGSFFMGLLIPLALPTSAVLYYLLYLRSHRTSASYRGLVKFFAFGAAVSVPVMLAESVLSLPLMLSEVMGRLFGAMTTGAVEVTSDEYGEVVIFVLYMSFIVAAFTEETAKYLASTILYSHIPLIEYEYTVILLIFSAALGFGTLENYFYVLNSARTGDASATLLTAATRAVLSVPLHGVTGVYIGSTLAKWYFAEEGAGVVVGKDTEEKDEEEEEVQEEEGSLLDMNSTTTTPSRTSIDRTRRPPASFFLRAMFLPVLIHGLFDTLAFTAGIFGGAWQFLYIGNICLMLVAWWYGYKRIRGALARDLLRGAGSVEGVWV